MLKTLALLLVSTSLFANDRVGEYTKSTFNYQGAQGERLTVVQSYNANENTYTLLSSATINGQTTQETEVVAADDLMSHETAEMLLGMCEMFGGAIETLNVAGANYDTCKMQGEDAKANKLIKGEVSGTVWIGDFAVDGIGKLESPEVTMELIDFKWNN